MSSTAIRGKESEVGSSYTRPSQMRALTMGLSEDPDLTPNAVELTGALRLSIFPVPSIFPVLMPTSEKENPPPAPFYLFRSRSRSLSPSL